MNVTIEKLTDKELKILEYKSLGYSDENLDGDLTFGKEEHTYTDVDIYSCTPQTYFYSLVTKGESDTAELEKRVQQYDTINSGNIIDNDWFSDNGYIYKYTDGLNTKCEELAPKSQSNAIPKAVYTTTVGDTLNKAYNKEYLSYKLNTPYREVNINRRVQILNNDNVLKELLRFLIQFQQLNYTYTSYNLGDVYDEAVMSITAQTGLIPRPSRLKADTLQMATTKFNLSVRGKDYKTVKEAVEGLNLYTEKGTVRPKIDGKDNRAITGTTTSKFKSKANEELINECIDAMIDAEMFISPMTIKEQLETTGLRQIKEVVKGRKLEIKQYNYNTFGVTTHAMYIKALDEV